MNEQQQRIADDLAGLFTGQLRFDDVAHQIYSTDASIYQLHPLGVAYPTGRDDLVTLMQYARDTSMPMIPRGAGSGVAGGAVGRGLIVDCSRHLTHIECRPQDHTVRVGAGVVRNELNRRLRQYGRYFAPDPATSPVTTIGGMLAVDAAGSHAPHVGSTRDHVAQLEIVLADGTLLEVGEHAWPTADETTPRLHELLSKLSHLLQQNRELIAERQPGQLRNASGYHLRTVLQSGRIHLPRLLTGSEGTLAVFSAATLHTTPLPDHRAVALVLFHDLEAALEAVQETAQFEPTACDLLDRRLLNLAREADSRFSQLIPPQAEAGLLIEHVGYTSEQVRRRLSDVLRKMREADSTLHVAQEAYTPDEVDFLWTLPQRVVPLLNRLGGETRPLPVVEDIAVPPAALRDFLVRAQRVFQKHWLTASLYAHAASGQVHFRPFWPAPRPELASQIESVARELYEVALACGGTVSGEHGNGLARTAFIRSQYGPLYRVFQQVKDLFDPHNLLNPGKIISDDAHLTIRDFRDAQSPHPEAEKLTPLQLAWDHQECTDAARRCNGCGDCRTQERELRMCPFFRIDPLEDASPRAKANLVRTWANGGFDARAVASEPAQQLADLCFNCKQCEVECPSQVDIPALAIELKGQGVAANGLPRADWLLSRQPSLARWGCRLAPLINPVLENRAARWFLETVFGIAANRRLPRFARREFVRGRKPSVDRPEAVYFVDYFVNAHDHELGRAFLQLAAAQGLRVHVPSGQLPSAMAMVSVGDLEAAREIAESNIRVLAEYAREGIPIVCTEPSAVTCLRREYPRILKHPDVAVVAENTIEAGEWLRRLRQSGRFQPEFGPLPLRALYHLPCHLRAHAPTSPLLELLSETPELTVVALERGCSGMAGAFGFAARNDRRSRHMGQRLIDEARAPEWQLALTECSSCKQQIEDGAALRTWHPLKVLAAVTGAAPAVKQQLDRLVLGRESRR